MEDPANAPAPLSFTEVIGVPGVDHSSVIVAAGAATTAPGPVGPGERLVAFPFRYQHTAVLTEEEILGAIGRER